MPYIPKIRPETNPQVRAGNTDIVSNSDFSTIFLSKYGDTSIYNYEFGNITVQNTLTAITVSSTTTTADYYYSGGTPLESIIQNIAIQYAGSGSSVNEFFESGITGSMAVQLKNSSNITSGDTSFVLGSLNSGYTKSSNILGGKNNLTQGTQYSYSRYASIVNGKNNKSNAAYSFVSNGLNNIVNTYANFSTVINGNLNSVSGYYNSIVGGLYNSILGGQFSAIVTGKYNKASAIYSFVGGGLYNINYQNRGLIGNGSANHIYNVGFQSSIVNGFGNIISGTTSTILGGKSNKIYSSYSAILNCLDNTIYSTGAYSIITNGRHNKVRGNYSAILNGRRNTIFSATTSSSILGGEDNVINNNVQFSSILGGRNITAMSSDTVYAPRIVAISLTSNTTNTVYVQPDGLLIIGAATSATTVGGSTTYVQPGLNTYTGGTSSNPTVNISAATLASLTVSGASSLAAVSATTIYSASTDLSLLFASTSTVNSNSAQIATKVNRSGDTMTGLLTTPSFSSTTISATTFYSGSTLLSSLLGETNTASNLASVGLFNSKVGTDLQFRGLSGGSGIAVTQQTNNVTITYTGITSSGGATNNNGLNTYTGGTSTFQSINISAATLASLNVSGTAAFNSLSAQTLSATTIYSASTDLSLLFASNTAINSTNSNVGVLQAQMPTKVNKSGDTMTGQLTAPSISATSISATTYYSGSTELGSLFPTKNTRKIFAQSRTVTGNTVNNTIQVLASVLIPGNTLAVGDSIEADCLFRFIEASASNKIGRIYLSSGSTNTTIGTTSADVLFSGQRTTGLQTWRAGAKVYITGATGQIWFSNGNSTTANINEIDADIPYLSLPINQDMYVLFTGQRPTTTTGITQLMCYDVFINKA